MLTLYVRSALRSRRSFLASATLPLLAACHGGLKDQVTRLEAQILTLKQENQVQAAKLTDLQESFLLISAKSAQGSPVLGSGAAYASVTAPTSTAYHSQLATTQEGPAALSGPSEFLELGESHPPGLGAKPVFTNTDLPKPSAKDLMTRKDAASSGASASTQALGVSDEEPALYRRAYEALRKGRLKEALGQFQTFYNDKPGDPYADRALYWIAHTHFEQGDYAQSVKVFGVLFKKYPRSNKIPEALLKSALAYERLGDTTKFQSYVARLQQAYPSSLAAQESQKHRQFQAKRSP